MSPALPGRQLGLMMLLVGSTAMGIAGTDLVLPAIPGLPALLGGDMARAQLVLASYTAGTALGLLAFGELGARHDQRRLLVGSLLVFSVVSLLCRLSTSLDMLIGLRFVQGMAGAAAAVFTPGIIRRVYGDDRAVRAIGILGSVEALAPALAPIAGLWLLHAFGWRASFDLLAVLSLGLAIAFAWRPLPAPPVDRGTGGYGRLLRDPTFLRYALSQACTLGALLVFVFGAPAVFASALGGDMGDFIAMQVTGVATFIVAANLSGAIAKRIGAEATILAGTACSALGGAGLLAYALAGGGDMMAIIAIYLLLNIGLGVRGPTGFHRAVVAAQGDDARGTALIVVAILLVAAAGTAAVAPFIASGLVPLAAGTGAIAIVALALLGLLPPLRD
ncbi:MFS transporter [Sphingomonas naphthae]|uniref:MFS transporter n=1 Tax=Sphingomonas naphthae TaxID=1813468 RepID=A0ABY7TIA6_9SPHN|nr:MFS transporter [Sphingomonas naphthae]WCT72536.1 MFS transporter [Sphingomonas naphthae]